MEERRVYNHVVVLGIDGMGCFNRDTATPNMDRIFKDGAVTYSALSMNPTISAENWGAMLLGAEPVVHGLTNGIVSHREYTNKELPSVFTRLRRAFPDAFLASYCNWEPINHGIIEHDVGVQLETADNDELLTEKIVVCAAKKPQFLFIQLDDVDGAGHHFGYGTKGHLDKITETDILAGRIYDAFCDAGIIEETLFLAIADHGGYRCGHGGYTDGEKYVFLAAAGKGVCRGNIGSAKTKDIAAVVLYALGLDVPEYKRNGFTSQIPDGIFPEVSGQHIVIEPKPSVIITRQTPDFDGEKGLSEYFSCDKIKLAMFLDYNLEDASGHCTATEHGAVKFYNDGVFGARAEFGATGHAALDGISFESGSFTLALWLKIDRTIIEPMAVCANKSWQQNRNVNGFVLALNGNNIVFNVSDGNDDFDYFVAFPDEISDGWIHTVVAVDRENREIRFYYDFKRVRTAELYEQFLCSYDGEAFTVGNDSTGTFNNERHKLLANVDDMFVFNGALSDGEVSRLEKYYNA